MARIFISYSRADTNFVEQFLPLAKRLFSDHQFFYDDHITGGEDWWQRILAEIAKADLFIYLLSNDSLESEYCQAEFREAQRLRKAILPVIVRRLQLQRAPEDIQSEIRRLNWVDMQKGFKDVEEYTRLQSSIRQHLLNISDSADVSPPISPEPISEPVVRDKKDSQISAAYIGGGFLLVSVIIAGIFGLWQGVFANNPSDDPPTQVVQEPTATHTPAMTNTPFDPVIASVTAIFQTSEAVNQLTQAALALTETELALQIAATETQEVNFLIMTNVAGSLTPPTPTPTWTPSLTPTHTPDLPATATRQVILGITATQQANLDATATQQANLDATATQQANLDATSTQQAVFAMATVDAQATATQEIVFAITATYEALPEPERVALEGVTSNAEWENLVGEGGYVREFDGIEMVLVPAGCFVIGSDNEDVEYAVNELGMRAEWLEDEQNSNEVCFESPLWIDLYEVTNEQYGSTDGSTGCEQWSSEPNQPRNCVTWFEALEHCEARGATLPTEAQWEYAARGVDSLIYPWGNDYIAENAIGADDLTYGYEETAPVGSRPSGASWVGALDMSGNLLEWTLSEYADYPYDANDGRNGNLESTEVGRVLRGGSFNLTSDNLRSANRLRNFPTLNSGLDGFRCARAYQP